MTLLIRQGIFVNFKKSIKKIDFEKSKQKRFCIEPTSLISCKYNFFTIFHGKKTHDISTRYSSHVWPELESCQI